MPPFPKIAGGAVKGLSVAREATAGAAAHIRETAAPPVVANVNVGAGIAALETTVSTQVTGLAATQARADAALIAARAAEANPLGVVDRQIGNVARYATSAATARGQNVSFSVDPSVNTFLNTLAEGNTNRGYLKSLVDGFVGTRLEAKLGEVTKPGQEFTVTLNPELTGKHIDAIKASLDIGGTIDGVTAKYAPLVLTPKK